MILFGLAVWYAGYALFYYGVEFALGVPLTLSEAFFPWKLTGLQSSISWAQARSGKTGKSTSAPAPTAPTAPAKPGHYTLANPAPGH